MPVGQDFGIEFPDGYLGQWEEDTPSRGWLEVKVLGPDGKRYSLSFYDPVTLKQALDTCVERGAIHYTEPNLIVITEVTTTNVRRAVTDLVTDGYFDAIKSEPSG